MTKITFEAHTTTGDNEAKRASGWNNAKLSALGVEQAKDLGRRRSLRDFDAVFTSDLERAYETATLAFGNHPQKIFMDWRLRECDYGEFTLRPSEEIAAERPKRVDVPFPGGESYQNAADRMWSFLGDLSERWPEGRVLLIGHRATQYALEHWVNDIPLEEVVAEEFVWQPGWEYELK